MLVSCEGERGKSVSQKRCNVRSLEGEVFDECKRGQAERGKLYLHLRGFNRELGSLGAVKSDLHAKEILENFVANSDFPGLVPRI